MGRKPCKTKQWLDKRYGDRNPSDFLLRLVTIDETWIHHYTPESKPHAKQWVRPGGTTPKRVKTQQSSGKVMASVF